MNLSLVKWSKNEMVSASNRLTQPFVETAPNFDIDCLTNLDCQLLEGKRFADQLSSWIAHAIMHNRIAGKAGREQDLEIGIAPQGFVGQAASVDVGVVRLRRLRGSRRLQVSPPTEKQS